MAKLEGIAIEQGLFKKYSDQDEEFIPFYDSTPELREVRKTIYKKSKDWRMSKNKLHYL